MNDQVYEHPNNPGTYHVDHLRTDLTSNQERAAFHGVAMNRAYSTPVRIQAALQALEMYEAEVEQLRRENNHLRVAELAWRERSTAQGRLLAHYRTQRTPNEALHRELERTRAVVDALTQPEEPDA